MASVDLHCLKKKHNKSGSAGQELKLDLCPPILDSCACIFINGFFASSVVSLEEQETSSLHT